MNDWETENLGPIFNLMVQTADSTRAAVTLIVLAPLFLFCCVAYAGIWLMGLER